MEEKSVSIALDGKQLSGDLVLPENVHGLVLFAHGSGSSHKSPRNKHVADYLHKAGLGTLLFDLMTDEEERLDQATGHLRFDIGFLASRLVAATDWAINHPDLNEFRIGYFGASTGAAAALTASVERPGTIRAIVSRGGRPDMAGEFLDSIEAPTLLIVGGYDPAVIQLNREAGERLKTSKKMIVIPEASHLFEEPGKLDEVAMAAADWFRRYLS